MLKINVCRGFNETLDIRIKMKKKKKKEYRKRVPRYYHYGIVWHGGWRKAGGGAGGSEREKGEDAKRGCKSVHRVEI